MITKDAYGIPMRFILEVPLQKLFSNIVTSLRIIIPGHLIIHANKDINHHELALSLFMNYFLHNNNS